MTRDTPADDVSVSCKLPLNRRRFLIGSIAAVGAMGSYFALRERELTGSLLSAFENSRGDQFVGGVRLATGEIFGAPVPMRAHGCAIDPRDKDRVVFFARRPGTQAFELNRTSLKVRNAFGTPAGRHLAGHGAYSANGDYLFTPEHDYANVRGVVAVRDARDYRIVAEIDTHGIDPHELAWSPKHDKLLVANGGIMTHPRTFRRKLNIPTMDPSLSVIDAATGDLLEQWRLPDHQLSIRHLVVASDGRAVAGLQYEGDSARAPSVVAIYHPFTTQPSAPSVGLRMLDAAAPERAKFRSYAASVALSATANLIAVACPYGNGVACWSLRDERYQGFIAGIEPYGVAPLTDGEMAMSQRDGESYVFTHEQRKRLIRLHSAAPIRWDDHWVAVDT
jgi:hypothetical protein